MKTRNVTTLYLVLLSLVVQSQTNIQREKDIQHWKMQPNGCIHFFDNEQFNGFLLDASKWDFSKSHLIHFISSTTNLIIDANSFIVETDTSIVWKFENLLRDTLKNNDTLITFPPDINMDFYYRQYVRFSIKGKDYLYVGFHIVDNDNSTTNKPCMEKQSNIKICLNELYILIASRHFLFQHYKWAKYDYQFFVLYDIELDNINFVYFESKKTK
jgi:hypothetical protein